MFDRSLGIVDFAAFFESLWGCSPFPWQTALVARVLGDAAQPWPQAITLPTASGKTACLDIAVFALAAQAERHARGEPLTAPRRVFFVVDRRVIVDEAHERAEHLARKLAEATTGVVKDVADRLRYLAGGEGDMPLASFSLRGGVYRDDAWARSPIQPTIVATTVDQFGSRLLFRGYGRSFKAWPLQAGLAGNDSLILLDEAHCAQPFMETLAAVAKYRQWAQHPLPSPFQLVVMTATPPQGVDDCFPDADTRRANDGHPVLGRRLAAAKPCRLSVAEKAQGKHALRELAHCLVQQAKALANDGPMAVAVLVNRVATAREVYRLLCEAGHDTALLTGRMRPLDKDDTVNHWLKRLSANASEERALERPVFIVATQTLEVGANLDFDAMVSECAGLDALRQRFGRLNRMGRDIQARGVIVIRADQEKAGADPDPVYGTALAATWRWLMARCNDHGVVDMGINALATRLPDDPTSLNMQPAHAPVMLPAHVDCWVQTAPIPCPSPDVGLFLHGPQSGAADVQVCWRADLIESSGGESPMADWVEAVASCPPASGELMPVPLAAFRHWLLGEDAGADSGDVHGVEPDEQPEGKGQRRVLRWQGPEDATIIRDPRDIRPGDVIVIPARSQGWDSLGHRPPETDIDLGDRAHFLARARVSLRLTPALVGQWPESPAREAVLALVADAETAAAANAGAAAWPWPEDETEQHIEALKRALADLSRDEATPGWLRDIAGHLTRERRFDRCVALHPGGLRVTRRQPVRRASGRLSADPAPDFGYEDDATASGTVPVVLPVHLRGVAAFAERFTQHLPATVAGDVQLAALCHDLGKADPRFQAMLNGGNPWVQRELLAKSASLPQGRRAYDRARARAGYPEGGRHELLSVRMLESAPDLLAHAHDPDLVLHLVASHHGHCRPFAPLVTDADPQQVQLLFEGHSLDASSRTALERLDSGVAERFWRLVRRYGWWGLAGLEAALMLSDHRRSEWEQRQAKPEEAL